MDSISKILDAITAEGDAEAEKILENGKKNAEEAFKLYEKEARIDEDDIFEKAEQRAKEIQQRSLSQAGIESRNIKLSARREAIEQVFSLAGEKLAGMEPKKKKALYEKLISKFSTSQKVTVQLNEQDSGEFGKKLKVEGVNISLDKKHGDFSGGLVIKEQSLETNCTFEVMIENAKKDMESEIAAMLFA